MTEQEQKIEMIVESMRASQGKSRFTKERQFFRQENGFEYTAAVLRMLTKGLIVERGGNYILTDYGWSFVGFEKERTEEKRIKDLQEEQVTSVIKTNRNTNINIVVTLILSAVVVWATVSMCQIERNRYNREVEKAAAEGNRQVYTQEYSIPYDTFSRPINRADSSSSKSAKIH